MSVEPAIRDQMLAALPSLRAFAISLCGNVDKADDLVQDTIMRAWGAIDRFERGTNLNAWLFTICATFISRTFARGKREVEDVDGAYAGRLSSLPEQDGRADMNDFRTALARLAPDQREALLLVGAQGFSYEETAAIMGCAIGTVKSRVNRARVRLSELLAVEQIEDLGPDRMTMAALQTPS
jgi:RNA polymerase sigma-70 factor (ECF subfamily)